MSTLINDPTVEPQIQAIIARRREIGADHHDEVWEGVYFMSPAPNNRHQDLVGKLTAILQDVIGWPELGEVHPGVNVSDRETNWRENYRVPDVTVFLKGTTARNCDTHWLGGPDFLIEIASLGDRSHEKLPFYAGVGVREALIINRHPWQLELYRLEAGELRLVSVATVQNTIVLAPEVVPLTFALELGDPPRIAVVHTAAGSGKHWLL
jgi:Uma2 family endonuclease